MDRIIAAEVFVTIIEQGSMASAARSLDMSRSMVTRYLNQMESWANAQLFHRSTRRLTLTPSGEKTLKHCRQLLEIAEEVTSPLSEAEIKPKGLLRISCSQFIAQDVLANMLQDFLLAYPLICIDIHISNQVTNLVEERIDLAIRITNDLDPNVIARPLGLCQSVLCATPEYLRTNGKPVHAEELSLHNCLMYSRFDKNIWHFDYNEEQVSAHISGNLSANEPMLLLQAVLMDKGISLQPKHAVMPYIKTGELVHVLPDFIPKTMGVYGIYRSRKHQSLAFRTFIDALVSHFNEIGM